MRAAERANPSWALVFGHQQTDRSRKSRLLKSFRCTGYPLQQEQMPELQTPREEKHQYQGSHQSGAKVADKHHLAAIPAIHQHTGKRADNHIGNRGEKPKQRQRRGCAFCLVGPDQQRKARHPCSKQRRTLAQYEHIKSFFTGQMHCETYTLKPNIKTYRLYSETVNLES